MWRIKNYSICWNWKLINFRAATVTVTQVSYEDTLPSFIQHVLKSYITAITHTRRSTHSCMHTCRLRMNYITLDLYCLSENTVCFLSLKKKKNGCERNITGSLLLFTFPILSNLSKLLRRPPQQNGMPTVKLHRNMTDRLHFARSSLWHQSLNCVFFPWRQTNHPTFN